MIQLDNMHPAEIEKESMRRIEAELGDTPHLSEKERIVLKRVIHTTADFEYKDNLKFSEDAVDKGLEALRGKAVIVTDTNMAYAGVSKPGLKKLGCELHCFMADEDIAKQSKEQGVTRASLSMCKARQMYEGRPIIFAVGNAPTALIQLYEMITEERFAPALVIGAPVGFVNIIQSKQLIMETEVPYIVADGRKGGSNVAAAICNALIYQLYDRGC